MKQLDIDESDQLNLEEKLIFEEQKYNDERVIIIIILIIDI